jgi:ATP sulfurylase
MGGGAWAADAYRTPTGVTIWCHNVQACRSIRRRIVTTSCYDVVLSQAGKACRNLVRFQLTAADILVEFVVSTKRHGGFAMETIGKAFAAVVITAGILYLPALAVLMLCGLVVLFEISTSIIGE